jgi:hypothetical protein
MITVIYFWRIKGSNIPFALFRMAIDRTLLRRTKGVTFAKMLGCGKGETFTPSDADPSRWGCLVVIPESQLAELDNSTTIQAWRKNQFLNLELSLIQLPQLDYGQSKSHLSQVRQLVLMVKLLQLLALGLKPARLRASLNLCRQLLRVCIQVLA